MEKSPKTYRSMPMSRERPPTSLVFHPIALPTRQLVPALSGDHPHLIVIIRSERIAIKTLLCFRFYYRYRSIMNCDLYIIWIYNVNCVKLDL